MRHPDFLPKPRSAEAFTETTQLGSMSVASAVGARETLLRTVFPAL